MATLKVTEFVTIASTARGEPNVPLAEEPASRTYTINFTGTRGNGPVIGASTTIVRMVASADCAVRFGIDAEAKTTDEPILERVPEWRSVKEGGRISVIAV